MRIGPAVMQAKFFLLYWSTPYYILFHIIIIALSWLYKAYWLSLGLLAMLCLKFSQCSANSVKLKSCAFVNIILIMQDIFNIKFQLLEIFA